MAMAWIVRILCLSGQSHTSTSGRPQYPFLVSRRAQIERPMLRTAVVGFTAGSLCWASWRLIQISKRWGATDSEAVRDLAGDELVPQGLSTT